MVTNDMRVGSQQAAAQLNRAIVECLLCPRLRQHCEAVARGEVLPRKAFAQEIERRAYWTKPVPNFGLAPAEVVIVGLAPAAHGANRTGRMFTGDDSGKWLYRALHKAGFAKTAGYQQADDNELIDTLITAVAHCAPPENKPNATEIKNCGQFLADTIHLANPKVIVALGGIAWEATLNTLVRELGFSKPKRSIRFSHLAKAELQLNFAEAPPEAHPRSASRRSISIVGSYHPSRQNTNTKKLTEPMLDSVFTLVRELLRRQPSSY